MIRDPRSGCPIATTLDIVGDRWTLVVLRDLLVGKKRFSEFLASPEEIATNVLTDRLALLEEAGLVTKTPYQLRPKRYEFSLTKKGEALLPTLQAMCRWANRFIPGTWTPPESFMRRKVK
ncbi:MAG: winged helix-turn-helix transcriptional regulator [Methyloceanibacter sp.]|uniref:winged helix-turn-helix transcriptional regulator n=1 Tax=Methyloceanibacter sp. TaxID=1965321 RepID=UPI003D6DA0BC